MMLPRSMVIHSINRGQRNGENNATKTNIVDGKADKPPRFFCYMWTSILVYINRKK